MKRLNEQGTIADIPLKSMSKLYYVRMENDQPVDQGWITVDEARRTNSADRRMYGSPQNRYFQDKQSANAFSQEQTAPPMGDTGMTEPPPEDFGDGMEEPMPEEEPMDDMGMGDDLGSDIDFDASEFDFDEEEPMDDMGEPDDLLGDLGGEDVLDDLGDTSDDLLGDAVEEEGVLELRVPRKIKLVPESMQERIPSFQGKPRFSNPEPGMFDEPEPAPEPEEEEPWREAPPGSVNPAQFQMQVSQQLMTAPEGPDILQKMQSDPNFFDTMSDIMTQAITRGDDPSRTAQKIISAFKDPGNMGAGQDWGSPWGESIDMTGFADKQGFTTQDVDPEQLAMGVEVELEHTGDRAVAEQIAMDHLTEIPDYYTRLVAMEKSAGESETTEAGVIEALLSGDLSAEGAVEEQLR